MAQILDITQDIVKKNTGVEGICIEESNVEKRKKTIYEKIGKFKFGRLKKSLSFRSFYETLFI